MRQKPQQAHRLHDECARLADWSEILLGGCSPAATMSIEGRREGETGECFVLRDRTEGACVNLVGLHREGDLITNLQTSREATTRKQNAS